MNGTMKIAIAGPYSYRPAMETIKIGYARCSTLSQDLEVQRKTLRELGVHENRIYTDHGLTNTNRERPGLDQALAALREGDTLAVSKLDRLARSVPDARAIVEELQKRDMKLALGAAVHDPTDPMGKMFFNIVATFAEFEAASSGCAPARAWRSQRRRESCGGNSQNCLKNNKKSSGECTIPGNIRSAILQRSSPYHGRPSIER